MYIRINTRVKKINFWKGCASIRVLKSFSQCAALFAILVSKQGTCVFCPAARKRDVVLFRCVEQVLGEFKTVICCRAVKSLSVEVVVAQHKTVTPLLLSEKGWQKFFCFTKQSPSSQVLIVSIKRAGYFGYHLQNIQKIKWIWKGLTVIL